MKIVKKKRKSLVIRIALLVFSVYVIIMTVDLQAEINNKKKQLSEIREDCRQQQLYKSEWEKMLQRGYDSEYMERTARERLGLVLPNERVFEIIK